MELPVGEADGQTVTVEIAQVGDGLANVARPGEVVAHARRSLGEMLAGVRPVAEHFVQGFRGMAHAPDEIGVEFGLSLSVKADVIISSTAAQANFKVTLKWRRQPTDEPATPTEPAQSAVEESTE
ncbi:MAG TPA: CU044_2847 family protein [Pseudonocardiaceae bacterium]|nr:CU044_2847 family protein [Pseudonocardiaceae bacterium]